MKRSSSDTLLQRISGAVLSVLAPCRRGPRPDLSVIPTRSSYLRRLWWILREGGR